MAEYKGKKLMISRGRFEYGQSKVFSYRGEVMHNADYPGYAFENSHEEVLACLKKYIDEKSKGG